MPTQPFNDVSLAEVLNMLYAHRDTTSSGVARRGYNNLIAELLMYGTRIRLERRGVTHEVRPVR